MAAWALGEQHDDDTSRQVADHVMALDRKRESGLGLERLSGCLEIFELRMAVYFRNLF